MEETTTTATPNKVIGHPLLHGKISLLLLVQLVATGLSCMFILI